MNIKSKPQLSWIMTLYRFWGEPLFLLCTSSNGESSWGLITTHNLAYCTALYKGSKVLRRNIFWSPCTHIVHDQSSLFITPFIEFHQHTTSVWRYMDVVNKFILTSYVGLWLHRILSSCTSYESIQPGNFAKYLFLGVWYPGNSYLFLQNLLRKLSWKIWYVFILFLSPGKFDLFLW